MNISRHVALMALSALLLMTTGCLTAWFEKSEYTDEEASAAEAVELEFFAKRQLPTGGFPGTSRLLSTALAMRCYLEASITPGNPKYGKTVESGLDFLLQQVSRQDAPISREDDAVELRVAVWTLVLAYGEIRNPNVLSAIRTGVDRLNQWNGRTLSSLAHTKYDEYHRMGMESLILQEMRSAGIGYTGSVFAETLEKAVRGVDRHEWFNHVSAIHVAFDVYGIDPLEGLRNSGVVIGMTMCCIPPREMSLDHYRVLDRLFCLESLRLQRATRGFERLWDDVQMSNLRQDRAYAINNLRKLDRNEDDIIREIALYVLKMPRPKWGRYFRRPSPKPDVDLMLNNCPREVKNGDAPSKKDVTVEVHL